MSCGFPCTNNSYSVISVCVGDDEQSPFGRYTDCDITIFVNRVIRIVECNRERITEDGCCFMERNSMLGEISFCFIGIPFEFHFQTTRLKIRLTTKVQLRPGDCQKLSGRPNSVASSQTLFKPEIPAVNCNGKLGKFAARFSVNLRLLGGEPLNKFSNFIWFF